MRGSTTLRVEGQRTRALAATMPPRRAPLRSSCSRRLCDFNDAPVAGSLAAHTVQEDVRQGARERYVSGSQVYGRGGQSFESCVHGFLPLTYTFDCCAGYRRRMMGIEDCGVCFGHGSASTPIPAVRLFGLLRLQPHRSWHAGTYKVAG